MRAGKHPGGMVLKEIPERVILLSDTLETPTLDNLWNYLEHFYEKVPSDLKDQFHFEDLAGIYTENGVSRLFAVCARHAEIEGLKVLPEGKYLCAGCSEENRAQVLSEAVRETQTQYGVEPAFTVQMIVISGILHWNYEVQIHIGR